MNAASITGFRFNSNLYNREITQTKKPESTLHNETVEEAVDKGTVADSSSEESGDYEYALDAQDHPTHTDSSSESFNDYEYALDAHEYQSKSGSDSSSESFGDYEYALDAHE